MSAAFEIDRPLGANGFGARVRLAEPLSRVLPEGLPAVLAEANGVMVIPGLDEVAARPDLLVALSRSKGDMRQVLLGDRA